jgi:hypothetical protein
LPEELEERLEHRSVVPHHPERLRHLADFLLAVSLRHRAEDAGDLGLGDAACAGHVVLLRLDGFGIETPRLGGS